MSRTWPQRSHHSKRLVIGTRVKGGRSMALAEIERASVTHHFPVQRWEDEGGRVAPADAAVAVASRDAGRPTRGASRAPDPGTPDEKGGKVMATPASVETLESPDSLEGLRQRFAQLETENAAMRPIVLRMAEARMSWDAVTMIESCPHCSLKRGGAYGYTGKHDEQCMVSRARALGF
jgi:hypothetical protein